MTAFGALRRRRWWKVPFFNRLGACPQKSPSPLYLTLRAVPFEKQEVLYVLVYHFVSLILKNVFSVKKICSITFSAFFP